MFLCYSKKQSKRKRAKEGVKTVVVDEKTCRSYVCVPENERRTAKATTEKYPETKTTRAGLELYR